MSEESRSKDRSITRKTFLKGGGAVLVLVAAGGAWRMVDQGVFSAGKGPAFEPWDNWRGEELRGAMSLIPAAILASNAHDTQPWLFRVEGSKIELFADLARDEGAADTSRREMYVSLGCALENLLLAAARGYSHVTLMPDASECAHAATKRLSPGEKKPSQLYDAIPHRHTNRYAYDESRPVPARTLETLSELNREARIGIERRFGGAMEDLIGDPRWRGVFTFRLGYPTEKAPESPRRAVRDVLM